MIPSAGQGGAASRRLTRAFDALSHPTRRRVLEVLQDGERSVGDLQQGTAASQSALSQHLAVLRDAGLVTARRNGRRRMYRLRIGPLRETAEWFAYFDSFWDARLESLGKHLEARS